MKKYFMITLTLFCILSMVGCNEHQPSVRDTSTASFETLPDAPIGYPSTAKRIWDLHHPDDSEHNLQFLVNIPELNNALIEYGEDCKIYVDGEYLIGGSGNGCESFYLSDLTGDGYPELCFSMNSGSGIVDVRIVIIDYITRETIYSLSDRMSYDYYLFVRNGNLCVIESEYMKTDAIRTGVLIYNGSEISVNWDSEVNVSVDRDN